MATAVAVATVMMVAIFVQKLIMAIILVGSALSILSARDYFPFSYYGMYSRPFEPNPNYTFHSVSGIDGEGKEISLPVRRRLPPFWMASFREALFVDFKDEALKRKLRAATLWFNSKAGSEPPIKGMRIYKHTVPWRNLVEVRSKKNEVIELLRSHRQLHLEVIP